MPCYETTEFVGNVEIHKNLETETGEPEKEDIYFEWHRSTDLGSNLRVRARNIKPSTSASLDKPPDAHL